MADVEHRFANVGAVLQDSHRTSGLRLHYVVAGAGEPVLLIHGFPQSWYEWRGIIDELAKHYTVIAPDYRGAGESARPQGGYDKHTMMEDLRRLVQQLGFERLRVVGHDIGAMIAYRYAAVYPDEVQQLVIMDAPAPGTPVLAQMRAMEGNWHIGFHNERNIAEMLVAGHEHDYLTFFFKCRFATPDAISPEDIGVYIAAYSQPGAMRAGFELYRAFDQDGVDNQPYLATKLQMPVLMLAAGAHGAAMHSLFEANAHEIADNALFRALPNAGHWMAEENPRDLEKYLLEFFETPTPA